LVTGQGFRDKGRLNRLLYLRELKGLKKYEVQLLLYSTCGCAHENVKKCSAILDLSTLGFGSELQVFAITACAWLITTINIVDGGSSTNTKEKVWLAALLFFLG
jgi:hypothetical protein